LNIAVLFFFWEQLQRVYMAKRFESDPQEVKQNPLPDRECEVGASLLLKHPKKRIRLGEVCF
jgi:hypothetical protein